jgi:hypothetical protein
LLSKIIRNSRNKKTIYGLASCRHASIQLYNVIMSVSSLRTHLNYCSEQFVLELPLLLYIRVCMSVIKRYIKNLKFFLTYCLLVVPGDLISRFESPTIILMIYSYYHWIWLGINMHTILHCFLRSNVRTKKILPLCWSAALFYRWRWDHLGLWGGVAFTKREFRCSCFVLILRILFCQFTPFVLMGGLNTFY